MFTDISFVVVNFHVDEKSLNYDPIFGDHV